MANELGDLLGAIAATRFGLGARPGEIETASHDPKAWLIAQIRPEGADQPTGELQSSAERLKAFYAYRADRKTAREDGYVKPAARGAGSAQTMAPGDTSMTMTPAPAAAKTEADARSEAEAAAFKAEQKALYAGTTEEFLARAQLGASTPASFRERWTLFWANHFTVSATKQTSGIIAGAFEREAIRPHVFGRFEDLLVASSRHPAMLFYLDQFNSFGPNSPAASRRKVGLNENLGREILELHTLGADAGYTQADVTEFARALTGASIGGERDGPEREGRYLYRPFAHEPGTRTLLGRQYADTGEGQARQILHDLAVDHRTARRISAKLAAHFVSDTPPPSLVERLTRAWLESDGRLDLVARALVEAPEAWVAAEDKFKTPYEFVISSYRSVGAQPDDFKKLGPVLTGLGQKPFSAPSPKGWPDQTGDWAAPDAVIKRLEYAKAFAAKAGPLVDPDAVAAGALGARMSDRTRLAIARAESRPEALALLLMSPEFQRR
jgi:uncharacterized protein (DUF1800 family)